MKINPPYSFDELRSLLYTVKEIRDIIFISTKSNPDSYFFKLWRS